MWQIYSFDLPYHGPCIRVCNELQSATITEAYAVYGGMYYNFFKHLTSNSITEHRQWKNAVEENHDDGKD